MKYKNIYYFLFLLLAFFSFTLNSCNLVMGDNFNQSFDEIISNEKVSYSYPDYSDPSISNSSQAHSKPIVNEIYETKPKEIYELKINEILNPYDTFNFCVKLDGSNDKIDITNLFVVYQEDKQVYNHFYTDVCGAFEIKFILNKSLISDFEFLDNNDLIFISYLNVYIDIYNDYYDDLSTKYNVDFNYNSPIDGLIVWTDFAINKTIAPYIENISEKDENSQRRTVTTEIADPYNSESNGNGMYFFAVDANGYIVYASYGLGSGYGEPNSKYYHNQDVKDIFGAPYWSLHDEYDFWPAKTEDGRNACALYDFMIPQDGFVIKGYYKDESMKALWKQITGFSYCPNKDSYIAAIEPKSLDKWYLSIDQYKQLSVRERQDKEYYTPSKWFYYDMEDLPIEYKTISEVKLLGDGLYVENVKGVVTYKRGYDIIIVDEYGDAIMFRDNATTTFNIGDTLLIDGTKTKLGSEIQISPVSRVEKIEKYGTIKAPDPIVVDENNVDEYFQTNYIYQQFYIIGAKVISKDSIITLQVGNKQFTLSNSKIMNEVSVGQFVDFYCNMISSSNLLFAISNGEDRITVY